MIKALQMGIVLLAGCLLLSAMLSGSIFVQSFLSTLWGNGLEIAGWGQPLATHRDFFYEW